MASNDGGTSSGWGKQPPWEDAKHTQIWKDGAPNPQAKPGKMVLTPAEIKTLQECSTESFWYRCAPLSIAMIATTQTLVNRGILRPHPRFGALFKNMGAALVAYVVGKMSYQGACRQKILALQNSPLADAMRRGKRGRELMTEMAVPGAGLGTAVEVTPYDQPQVMRDEVGYLNPDTNRSRQVKELDDNLRPSLQNDSRKRTDSDSTSTYTSYDELRRQNREEYEQKMAAAKPPPSRVPSQPSFRPPPSQSAPHRPNVNQYGDVIEE